MSKNIVIEDTTYRRNSRGDLVPLANIKPVDLLMDEMVDKLIEYGEDLSAEMARFRAHSMADIAQFDALIAQEYNVSRADGRKGNRTFTSYDGCRRVQVSVADRVMFGPELQAAKQLLDELIASRSGNADPVLLALVNRAFRVDQEGKVNKSELLALARMDIDDPRWPNIKRAIGDAERTVGTATYLRLYARSAPDAVWQMVPLDMAAIEVSSAAFARRSLRRTVEDARALADRANHLLCQDHFSGAHAVVEQLQALLGGGMSPTPRAAANVADEEAA
jgi:hypothetical protein